MSVPPRPDFSADQAELDAGEGQALRGVAGALRNELPLANVGRDALRGNLDRIGLAAFLTRQSYLKCSSSAVTGEESSSRLLRNGAEVK